ELTNAIDVGSPKPLGQQHIKVLPQNFIAAPSKCVLSPLIESCDALLVIDRDNGFRSDREKARKKQSRDILGCHADRAPASTAPASEPTGFYNSQWRKPLCSVSCSVFCVIARGQTENAPR